MSRNDFIISNGVLKKYEGSDEHIIIPNSTAEDSGFIALLKAIKDLL